MMAICAEHGTAVTIIAERIIFSRLELMVRMAMIAGTLHPIPTIMGMKAPPWSPNLCIMLSRRTTARVR